MKLEPQSTYPSLDGHLRLPSSPPSSSHLPSSPPITTTPPSCPPTQQLPPRQERAHARHHCVLHPGRGARAGQVPRRLRARHAAVAQRHHVSPVPAHAVSALRALAFWSSSCLQVPSCCCTLPSPESRSLVPAAAPSCCLCYSCSHLQLLSPRFAKLSSELIDELICSMLLTTRNSGKVWRQQASGSRQQWPLFQCHVPKAPFSL